MKKYNHTIHLLACGLASFVLFAATVMAGDNLAVNGNFDDDTKGWSFNWRTGSDTPPQILPDQLAIVTPKEGGNLLRITIPEVTDAGLHEAHGDGAVLKLSSAIPATSKLLVRLKARSVSGASCLTIDRLWGGASGIIAQLDSNWKTIEAKLDLATATPELCFALTDKIPGEIMTWEGAVEVSEGIYTVPGHYCQFPVQEGVLEIKDVSVEEVPAQ